MPESKQHADIACALAALELELRVLLALRDSRSLRAEIAGEETSVLIGLPMEAGYLAISAEAISLSRTRPVQLETAPLRTAADLLASVAAASPAASEGMAMMEAGARRLITNLFFDDRWDYRQLAPWTAFIEVSAYNAAGRISMGLDRMRRTVHDAGAVSRPDADDLVVGYRKLVEALGRTTLFATDAGAPWLAEVGSAFEWSRWTPSFPLVRERDLRSVAIGARAASRFGAAMIERYLAALRRAKLPLFALDAIVALTAIGLRHDGEREAILRSLEREAAGISNKTMPAIEMVAVGHIGARDLLSDANASSDVALLDRRLDAFNLDTAGRMPIFAHLARAVDAPVEELARAGMQPKSVKTERELFFRAWGEYPSLASLPDSAFRRA
jgi:hypothetical protein